MSNAPALGIITARNGHPTLPKTVVQRGPSAAAASTRVAGPRSTISASHGSTGTAAAAAAATGGTGSRRHAPAVVATAGALRPLPPRRSTATTSLPCSTSATPPLHSRRPPAPPPSLFLKLARRSRTGARSFGPGRLHTRIPPSLALPMESLFQGIPGAQSCVFLGWARSGGYLLSYSFDGALRFELQAWQFAPHRPLRLHVVSPLFPAADWSASSSMGGLVDGTQVRVAIWEPVDSGCMVVTGFLHERSASRVPMPYYVTVLPGLGPAPTTPGYGDACVMEGVVAPPQIEGAAGRRRGGGDDVGDDPFGGGGGDGGFDGIEEDEEGGAGDLAVESVALDVAAVRRQQQLYDMDGGEDADDGDATAPSTSTAAAKSDSVPDLPELDWAGVEKGTSTNVAQSAASTQLRNSASTHVAPPLQHHRLSATTAGSAISSVAAPLRRQPESAGPPPQRPATLGSTMGSTSLRSSTYVEPAAQPRRSARVPVDQGLCAVNALHFSYTVQVRGEGVPEFRSCLLCVTLLLCFNWCCNRGWDNGGVAD